ncbi:alpha/beta hydrolase [Fulvivirgaceae bacterium BMA10]|uniref:Alpha/beta hydrolase n=1 Tax=Splendidivirga corallicola TaxID=3051826 RepID=A0ABT8KHV1_9BACT|nr:alpha/beta hydrolase [Fulvivirgaceae bacterium BMA10]
MIEIVTINTVDDCNLTATLFSEGEKKKALVIISSATAVPQSFYHKFSYHVAQQGMDVITFDYRGLGRSVSKNSNKVEIFMSDWGSKDLASVIEWARNYYEKLFLIGHSVAGQIFPMAFNAEAIEAAYLVGSQTASYHYWSGKEKILVLIFWNFMVPVLTSLYGYLPGWTMGNGHHLHKGVAREWRSWGIHPKGVLQDDPEIIKKFADLKLPMHFVNMEDDRLLAPAKATKALMSYYCNAKTTYEQIKPLDFGEEKIGHFGFFKSKFKNKTWTLPVEYFKQFDQ